jgi:mono/diheme cytochrome c family protein
VGGDAASDLGKRTSRNYTPAYVAGVMWNHAVSGSAGLGKSALSEDQTADLFAYFASRRYFEPLGDAKRGQQVFDAKGCFACHGISEAIPGGASPITEWGSLRDPIAFAQEMWNRSPAMVRAFARQGTRHPHLTSQELNDLLVYLENLPAVRGKEPEFRLSPAETGLELFQAKGCAGCHRGKLSLERSRSRHTMADVSAAMWNHPPGDTYIRPTLSYSEMSGLVSYLWSLEDRGDETRGRIVYARKKCGACHSAAGSRPDGSRIAFPGQREAVPMSIVKAMASHGPRLNGEASGAGAAWPQFRGSEMTDLVAYLETQARSASEGSEQAAAAGLGSFQRR